MLIKHKHDIGLIYLNLRSTHAFSKEQLIVAYELM